MTEERIKEERIKELIESGKLQYSPFGLIPTKESSLEDLITEISVLAFHRDYVERWGE